METVKIKFNKKKLLPNLIIGIVWSLLAVFGMLENDNRLGWSNIINLIIGIIYLGGYLYNLKNQYLTIENGMIWKSEYYKPKKRLNLKDINWIKKFAGDYTLKTEGKELIINTSLINKDSLVKLNTILSSLNLPPERTPFTNTI